MLREILNTLWLTVGIGIAFIILLALFKSIINIIIKLIRPDDK